MRLRSSKVKPQRIFDYVPKHLRSVHLRPTGFRKPFWSGMGMAFGPCAFCWLLIVPPHSPFGRFVYSNAIVISIAAMLCLPLATMLFNRELSQPGAFWRGLSALALSSFSFAWYYAIRPLDGPLFGVLMILFGHTPLAFAVLCVVWEHSIGQENREAYWDNGELYDGPGDSI